MWPPGLVEGLDADEPALVAVGAEESVEGIWCQAGVGVEEEQKGFLGGGRAAVAGPGFAGP